MQQINVEGERFPIVMYKPYIWGSIVYCSNHFIIFCPHGEVKVKKISDKYKKKLEAPNMRDPKRIDPFLEDLGTIWKNCCPDWRFGQLIENVFGDMDYVPFMLEEPRMIEEIGKYFKIEKDPKFMKQLNIYKNVKERKNNGKNRSIKSK